MKKQKVLYLALFALILSGCGDMSSGSGPCGGGIEDGGNCVRIEKVTPVQITIEDDVITEVVTNDVDVVPDQPPCTDGTPEPFGSHSAKITFSNSVLPNVDVKHARDVTLTEATITYSNSQCAPGSICPALPPLPIDQTHFLEKETTLEVTVDLITFGMKAALTTATGDAILSSYVATYTFTGEDEDGEAISVTASTPFNVANFDNCPDA